MSVLLLVEATISGSSGMLQWPITVLTQTGGTLLGSSFGLLGSNASARSRVDAGSGMLSGIALGHLRIPVLG